MAKSNSQPAFTLIELLIVVAIIGILAAIAVPNFLNALVKAKVAAALGVMKTIEAANAMYMVDYGTFMPVFGGSSTIAGFDNSFRQFTTPIAYLSSRDAAKDPFASKTKEGFSNPRQEYDQVLDYTPGFAGGTPQTYTNKQGIYMLRVANTFLLESVGPDALDSVYASPCFGSPSCVFELFSIYHSSNGVISQGDIIHRGEGVPQHVREFFK